MTHAESNPARRRRDRAARAGESCIRCAYSDRSGVFSARCGGTPLTRDVFDGADPTAPPDHYSRRDHEPRHASRLKLTAADACIRVARTSSAGARAVAAVAGIAGATLATPGDAQQSGTRAARSPTERRGSLLAAIDRTVRRRGSRLLAQRLSAPLTAARHRCAARLHRS